MLRAVNIKLPMAILAALASAPSLSESIDS